jgi:archaellum component FlaD/FlaE
VATAAPQLVLEDPFASVAPALEPPLAEPPAPSSPDLGLAAFATPPPTAQQPAAPLPAEEPMPNGVRLYDIQPTFGASLLVLNWADMLLKHAPSRESVDRLLDYYCNVGWLGEPARDRILAYVDGIRYEARGEGAGEAEDWRAGVEVHERSLLFIEKLRALGARGE